MKTLRLGLATILAGALTFGAVPAFAMHCPMDMKQIDEALAKGTSLSETDLEKVKALRAEGEKLHKEGKHADSVKALGEAKAMLGLE
ncbi:MAG: hypothetical protein H6923_06510 [Alphaproteobacteria bacterium]|nr:hypothetical protein [Alphaproteobacteria bacterium]